MILKKRLLVALLVLVVIAESMTVILKADEKTIYQSSAMQNLIDDYFYYEDFLNILTTDAGIAYWMSANELADNEQVANMFALASGFIGEAYSEEDYAELLAYLMATNELYLAEMIENMSSFNGSYDLHDFSKDMISIANDTISSTNNFGLTEDGSAEDTIVGTFVDALGDIPQLNDDLADNKKYYYTIIQDYTSDIMFLSAIYNNTNSGALKEAAKKMLEMEEKCFIGKMEYFSENIKTFDVYGAKVYAKNLFLPVLEIVTHEEGYEILASVADALGELVKKVFGEGKLTFDVIMTFVGDLTFATTDSYRCQNEINALAEIARCVAESCNEVDVAGTLDKETFENIQKKLYLYKMLLTIHSRGEYSIHKMITNQMNVLVVFDDLKTELISYVRSIFQGKPYRRENPKDKWYEAQVAALSDMESALETLAESSQFITHNAYITANVLCGDTGDGAYNAMIIFSSDEGNYLLFAAKDGTVKGYVAPGVYEIVVTYGEYQTFTDTVTVAEDGTCLGDIVLTKEGQVDKDFKGALKKITEGKYYDSSMAGFAWNGNLAPYNTVEFDFDNSRILNYYEFGEMDENKITSIDNDQGMFIIHAMNEYGQPYCLTGNSFTQTFLRYDASEVNDEYFNANASLSERPDDWYKDLEGPNSAFAVLPDNEKGHFTGLNELSGMTPRAVNDSGYEYVIYYSSQTASPYDLLTEVMIHIEDKAGRYDITRSFNLEEYYYFNVRCMYLADINNDDEFLNIIMVCDGEDGEMGTHVFAFNRYGISDPMRLEGELDLKHISGDGEVFTIEHLGIGITDYGAVVLHHAAYIENLNMQENGVSTGHIEYDSNGVYNEYLEGCRFTIESDLPYYRDQNYMDLAGIVPAGTEVSLDVSSRWPGVVTYANGSGYVNSTDLRLSNSKIHFAG